MKHQDGPASPCSHCGSSRFGVVDDLRVEVASDLHNDGSGTLERLTKCVSKEIPADHDGTECEEALMDVGAPLVANCQSPKSVKPGECALDNPAIAAKSCGRLDATTRDSRPNAAHTAGDPRVTTVVRLVGMELRRTTARSTPRPTNRADRVEEVAKLLRVVFVCSGQLRRCQRDTSPVDNHMVLRARLCSVGGIRTRGRPSLKRAHARSIERRTRPVDLASASELVLQHLENPLPDPRLLPIAEPAPTCHATSTAKLPRKVLPRNPVLRTNRMPVSALRCGTGLRPRYFGRSGGRCGAMRFQSSSLMSGRAMPISCHATRPSARK